MKKRLWIVIRIQDYRITALACSEDPCWEELSGDTIISEDREEQYQRARQYGGLLCSAEGVPSARQATKYHEAVSALKREGAPTPAAANADPDWTPTEGQE